MAKPTSSSKASSKASVVSTRTTHVSPRASTGANRTRRTTPSASPSSASPQSRAKPSVMPRRSKLSHDAQHSQRQRMLQRSFFLLAQKEAARALRLLHVDDDTDAEQHNEQRATTVAGTGTAAEPVEQKTLAQLFSDDATSTDLLLDVTTDTDSARGVLAKLWSHHVSIDQDSRAPTDAAQAETCTDARVVLVEEAERVTSDPAQELARCLAQRAEQTVKNHIRYPWPYHILPSDSCCRHHHCYRPPAPLVMTPSQWHPRSAVTGRAYRLLHMSSSGLTTVTGVETEALEGTDGNLSMSFFDLCGIR